MRQRVTGAAEQNSNYELECGTLERSEEIVRKKKVYELEYDTRIYELDYLFLWAGLYLFLL